MNNWIESEKYKKKTDERELEISVVGLGYVGLPLASVFASKGFPVIGYDVDSRKIDKLEKKENYLLEERWLDDIIRNAYSLRASSDVEKSGNSDFISITVPTPSDEKTKKPIYDFVRKSSESVGKNLRRGALVVLESTVGPGTTEHYVRDILESESGLVAGEDFGLAFSPERINPGDENHRIYNVPKVIGGLDDISADLGAYVYSQIVPSVHKVGSPTEAELVKLFENVQRDVNIALANEFAIICDLEGCDVLRVIEGAGTKWNFMKVYPGCGVGGHCLPDDPYFLISESERKGHVPLVMKTARKMNDSMPRYTVDKIIESTEEKINPKVSVLGISYKENTGDPRGTPTKKIVRELKKMGVKNIVVHDPHVSIEIGAETTKDVEHALKDSDVVIIATGHDEYRKLEPDDFHKLSGNVSIVDGRNIYDPEKFKKSGIRYSGIGRG